MSGLDEVERRNICKHEYLYIFAYEASAQSYDVNEKDWPDGADYDLSYITGAVCKICGRDIESEELHRLTGFTIYKEPIFEVLFN